ncbi:RagB/SusD family nutrient uptake outer membrane protein [Seonamhaeicola marinus]|uniref:RagB/SusD family nutrient uptake outer membrane protein n=1 Tax=Seonamhaeicola marinus TaxID=1912246 RepID=A0A5D0HTS9_9FLAO|nr:RagB/SusD family nutrient uptake outer membrane protein [Seonamhaeicola marinus]TYA74764.1 RagB/SusD family nutrient uptake outer membrane protein [Seonamhaeicola marinus]
MKKYVIVFVSLFFVFACSSDFLDRKPLSQIASSSVFEDESLANAFLNNVVGRLPSGQYNSPGGGYGNNYLLASITDEARAKSGWIPANNVIINGSLRPTNHGGLNIWSEAYRAIREANQYIEGAEASMFTDEFKASTTAQARFVRAWFYFDLVRRYGAVPLITAVQTLEDDLFVSRTPVAQIYDFINNELTAIASILPNKSEAQTGELTRQAAIALNARAMLYDKRYAESAALANQLITGSANDGLELYGANPANAEEAINNYKNLFLSEGGNIETVYEQLFLAPDRIHQFDEGNWPVRWRNDRGGQTDPTQELVDAYEMENGLPITDAASGYDPADPYTGRDPRFYASIFYHGSEFSEVLPSRGEPFIDMEWNAFNEGPGTRRDGNASITGYLVRKFVDPSLGFAPGRLGKTAWQEIRFAEVLLIFAEAENESNGPTAAVYDAVNRIRARAAIPALPAGLSQSEMRDRIRHERRIELVFENHRWFDLIRWDEARTVLNATFNGIRIERNGIPTAADGGPTHVFDPAQLTFTTFEITNRVSNFPDAYMLLPIPQGEIDKNPNLRPQNPGYE